MESKRHEGIIRYAINFQHALLAIFMFHSVSFGVEVKLLFSLI